MLIGLHRRRFQIDEAQLNDNSTDTQRTSILRRSTVLRSKLRSFHQAQQLYCPAAAALRFEASERLPEGSPASPVHSISLWLPSDIGRTKPCDTRLQEYEWRLRYSQAADALSALRGNLHYLSAVFKHKDRFARSQDAHTRSNVLVSNINGKGELIAKRYRRARECLVRLDTLLHKDEEWRLKFQPLDKGDIRIMSDPDATSRGRGEGRRELSWIWVVSGVGDEQNDVHIQDGMFPTHCDLRTLTFS